MDPSNLNKTFQVYIARREVSDKGYRYIEDIDCYFVGYENTSQNYRICINGKRTDVVVRFSPRYSKKDSILQAIVQYNKGGLEDSNAMMGITKKIFQAHGKNRRLSFLLKDREEYSKYFLNTNAIPSC